MDVNKTLVILIFFGAIILFALYALKYVNIGNKKRKEEANKRFDIEIKLLNGDILPFKNVDYKAKSFSDWFIVYINDTQTVATNNQQISTVRVTEVPCQEI